MSLTIDGTADIELPSDAEECNSVSHVCIKLTHEEAVYSKCYEAVITCAAGATVSEFSESDGSTTLTTASTTVSLSTTIMNTGVDIAAGEGNFELNVYLSASDQSGYTGEPTAIVDDIPYAPADDTLLGEELLNGNSLPIDGTADIALPTDGVVCNSVAYVCVKMTHSGDVYSKCYEAEKSCDCSSTHPHCDQCDASSCLVCDYGYILVDGSCSTCSEAYTHCNSCEDDVCVQCEDQYLLQNGQCVYNIGADLYEQPESDVDHTLSGADIHQMYHIQLSNNIFELNCEQYSDIYVYRHGFVSLGREYAGYTNPESFSHTKQTAIIAPLMALTQGSDAESSVAKITQIEYVNDETPPDAGSKEQRYIDRVKQDVVDYYNDQEFEPTLIILVTYYEMAAYPYSSDSPRNTFQLIMAMDGRHRKSYTIFHYHELGWRGPIPNVAGIQSPGDDTNTFTVGLSTTELMFTIHQEPSNIQPAGQDEDIGVYFIKTSQAQCEGQYYAPYLCLNWYNQQDAARTARRNRRVDGCPCNLLQVQWAPQFSLLEDEEYCAVTNSRGPARKCCYRSLAAADSVEINPVALILDVSRSFFMEWNPLITPSKSHFSDVLPRQWCCRDSDNCNMFRVYRPSKSCSAYESPSVSATHGDPHFVTPDGLHYTFNGLGEFIFLKSLTLNIQIRAKQAVDADGEAVRASIFSAVVMQSNGTSKIQIEVGSGTPPGMDMYSYPSHPEQPNLSQWYTDSPANTRLIFDEGNLIVTRLEQAVKVTFVSDGTSVTCEVGAGGDLLVNLAVSQQLLSYSSTSGLLGEINGNPDDDYLLPDGLYLSPDINEESVYRNFGPRWRVNRGDTDPSMFVYHNDKTANDYLQPAGYTPVFAGFDGLSDAQKLEMEALCNGVYTCKYDFALTNNPVMAESSRGADEQVNDVQKALANIVPVLSVSEIVMLATLNQETSITVEVNDSNDDLFTFENTLPDEDGFVVTPGEDKLATYTWTPTTTDPVEITFGGKDSSDFPAVPITVSVRLCDCKNGGTCNPNRAREGQTNENFQLMQCTCSAGWTGVDCSTDKDGCADEPCGQRNCTDLTPEEEVEQQKAYNCAACPEGSYAFETICLDFDECGNGTNPCSSEGSGEATCINASPGFTCSCSQGYHIEAGASDKTTCVNIDECTAGVHDCSQRCEDTVGSYNCSCYEGYELAEDGVSCEETPDAPSLCEGLDCEGFCAGANTCGCPPGQKIENTVSCVDIDECTDPEYPHACDELSSECNNVANGYTCTCKPGYKSNGDSRTCTACGPGKWGVECANTCNCLSADDCDAETGCGRCPPGREAPACGDVDECDAPNEGRCGDHGDCRNTVGSFSCDCEEGYLWNQTMSTDACVFNNYCKHEGVERCQNGATCVAVTNNYTCTCVQGYEGRQCEDNINDCADDPCADGSTCSDLVNGYTCLCPPGKTGQHCSEDLLECESEPCMNGGQCQEGDNQYTCQCTSDWTGVMCEEVNECGPEPCQNDGECIDGDGEYTCRCPPQWTGDNCQTDVNECVQQTSDCPQHCQNTDGGYTCSCFAGYTPSNDGRICTPHPDTAQACIDAGLTCDATYGLCVSSVCQCMTGYELAADNQQCQNINECTTDTHECGDNAQCSDTDGSYTCTCDDGYLMQPDGRTCTLINKCLDPTPAVKCYNEGTCRPVPGAYECDCADGFSGDTCLEEEDECESNPCQHGASCRDLTGRYVCECAAGYVGTHCETEIDECDSTPCQHDGNCTDQVGTYSCECTEGYTGDQCESEINYCVSSPCQNGGTCEPRFNGYICQCTDGYTDAHCTQDIDECGLNTHNCAQMCNNTDGGYECTCADGYTLNEDGHTCDGSVDCTPACVGDNVYCGVVDGSPACACQDGYQLVAPDNVECEERNYCLSDDTNECGAHSVCRNIPGNYVCDCEAGYQAINARECEEIYECASSPCQYGTCDDLINGYECDCQRGYDGDHCENNIDDCAAVDCGAHGTCEDGIDRFTCVCEEGYEGTYCETDTDECSSSPCNHGNCTDLVNSYQCECEAGYEGDQCETNIDECSSSPCIHGNCTDLVNSYQCECEAGYEGDQCETNTDDCTPSPCGDNGRCEDGVDSYTCVCNTGYTGLHCDTEIPVCLEDSCSRRGTCSIVDDAIQCTCIASYEGPTCQTPIPTDSIPRKTIESSMSMDVEFDTQLLDQESAAYTELRDTLVTSLDSVYTEQYGADYIGVTGVLFTSGSTQASWEVVLRLESTVTAEELQTALTEAVQASNGTFVEGYPIDVATIQTQAIEVTPCQRAPCNGNGRCIDTGTEALDYRCQCYPRYTGTNCTEAVDPDNQPNVEFSAQVTMSGQFNDDLLETDSLAYTRLKAELETALVDIYSRSHPESFLGVSDFVFSSGSIIASWRILFTDTSGVTAEELTEVLTSAVQQAANNALVDGYSVDVDSIVINQTQGQKKSSSSTLLGVIIGAILGVFFLALAISFCVWHSARNRIKRQMEAEQDWDTVSQSSKSSTFWPRAQARHWFPTPEQMMAEGGNRSYPTTARPMPGPALSPGPRGSRDGIGDAHDLQLHRDSQQFVNWSMLHNAAHNWGLGKFGRANRQNTQDHNGAPEVSWTEARTASWR